MIGISAIGQSSIHILSLYGCDSVPVRVELGSSTGGTWFQYGWNSVPIRMELGSSTDGTLMNCDIGFLQIFI